MLTAQGVSKEDMRKKRVQLAISHPHYIKQQNAFASKLRTD
jgi:hypothetical protein